MITVPFFIRNPLPSSDFTGLPRTPDERRRGVSRQPANVGTPAFPDGGLFPVGPIPDAPALLGATLCRRSLSTAGLEPIPATLSAARIPRLSRLPLRPPAAVSSPYLPPHLVADGAMVTQDTDSRHHRLSANFAAYSTSTTISTSTGARRGRPTMPTAEREWRP